MKSGLVILLAISLALAVSPLSADVPRSVSAMTFGAKGDGVTDDTAAIQKALDSLPAGGIVNLPAGRYLLSAQLNVPKYTTLMGEGERWENQSTGLIVLTNGFSAVQLGYSSGIKAMMISYPNNRDIENPQPYPPAILLHGGNCVENIVFDCAWIGISTPPGGYNSGQGLFRDITGFVHSVGMHFSGCRDVNRIMDVHWFVGGHGDVHKSYYRKNRVGFEFGDVDGVLMSRCFMIGGKTFLHQLADRETADGKGAPAHSMAYFIEQSWIEDVNNGFIFEGKTGFSVTNANILVRKDGVGIKVANDSIYYNAVISGVQVRPFGNVPFTGFDYNPVTPHPRNRLSISDCQVTDGGSPGVHLGPGAIRANIHDNHFVSAEGQPAIQIDKGADLFVITDNVFSSRNPIVDLSGRRATKVISNNLVEKLPPPPARDPKSP